MSAAFNRIAMLSSISYIEDVPSAHLVYSQECVIKFESHVYSTTLIKLT